MSTPPTTPRQEVITLPEIGPISQNWQNHRYTLIGSGSVAVLFAISALSGGPLSWIVTASLLAVTATAYFLFLLFCVPEESQPLTHRETVDSTPISPLSRKISEDPLTPTDITYLENLRSQATTPASDPCPMTF